MSFIFVYDLLESQYRIMYISYLQMIYPVDAKSVKTSAAYILFYRRRKFETKSHEK